MFNPDQIVPTPKQLTRSDKSIVLGSPGQAACQLTIQCPEDSQALKNSLALLNETFSRLIMAVPGPATAGAKLVLELADPPADLAANPDLLAQGYRLKAQANQVTVTGFGPEGLYFGTRTLTQCLDLTDNLLTIPEIEILDWPDLKTRGHFMESRYGSNLMTLADWQEVIDQMSAIKMNQLAISLYGCWVVQYDGRVSEYLYMPLKAYPELETPVVCRYYSPEAGGWIDEEKPVPMVAEDFFGQLVAYGQTRGVTVFPLVNSFGHNTLLPASYPAVSAKDIDGQPTLTGFCTAEEETYKLLFTIYDEIIDRYLAPSAVDSFHIGLDEVWDQIAANKDDIYKVRSPWCQCPVCRDKSRQDIFIDHLIRLARHLKDRGMKNIYVYSDMLIGHGDSIKEESVEHLVAALQENDLFDLVVVDWWTYSAYADQLMFQTTHPELGLRRTVKPWNGYYHWTVLTDALANISLLAEMGVREKAEGMLSYSAWDMSYDINHLGQADMAWNQAATGSPAKIQQHYAGQHFASRKDEAVKGLELLASAVFNNKQEINPYDLLLAKLSYYFYSYVRENKPYPRLFPGEALATLAPNQAAYAEEISHLGDLAQEASTIFSSLATDPAVNQKMARRLAYEADNIVCLTGDYLALFQMQELAGQKSFDQIKQLAVTRRTARLALMDQLEQVKEAYLLPSHMRNHSIFMQYFTDLAAYLATTAPADVKLDFTDNSHFASQAFWQLR